MRDQDHIQQQEQGSKYWMEDWDIQVRKETYSGLHDKVQNIGHKGWYRWFTHHLLVEKECVNGYYQNDIRIPTDSNARNTQRVEDGHNISRTRIQVYRRTS